MKVEGDKIVEGNGISELLVKGTLIPGVWNGGNHLIDMANTATPDQLASILQSHHLVNNPAAAHDQAQSVLAEVQSKGGNAFLFGGLAGALAFVVVDIAKPKLQLEIKLAIAAVVFVLVASLM